MCHFGESACWGGKVQFETTFIIVTKSRTGQGAGRMGKSERGVGWGRRKGGGSRREWGRRGVEA